MTRDERLDQATADLSAHEPYFAPTYQAARTLLRSALFGAFVIKWQGATVRDGHCGCQGRCECLHEVAYRIYQHATP